MLPNTKRMNLVGLTICNLSAIPKAYSGVVISYSKIELSTAVSVSPLTTDSQKNPENLRVMLYYKCGRAGLGPSYPPMGHPPRPFYLQFIVSEV